MCLFAEFKPSANLAKEIKQGVDAQIVEVARAPVIAELWEFTLAGNLLHEMCN